ncbi:hypothetical protein A0H81_11028 [Grifola frondosa]|uniref:F-box domain-containing protein n=1 Tax=Grifola frondosa TaxID=5627 RepID=A0A1C7LW13_GRIFR|nr:hypothetical protein A0H81_11028 [Grifola frondosa]
MPFIFKRSHHRDTGFRRSFVDAVKSIYTSERVSVTDAERPYGPLTPSRLASGARSHFTRPPFGDASPRRAAPHVGTAHIAREGVRPRHTTPPARQSSHLNYYNLAQVCMHFAAPHIHRWRSLEIKFTHCTPFLWNAALSGCCGRTGAVEAPSLRELSLVYPDNDDTKEFTLFNGHAPRLRRATLHGIRLAWLPSLFQNLTFLDYTHHGFTHGHAAASEVLYMLLEPYASRASASSRLASTGRTSRRPSFTSSRTSRSRARFSAPPRQRPDVRRRLSAPSTRPQGTPAPTPLAHLHLAHAWLEPRFLAALIAGLSPPGVRHLSLEGPLVTHAFLLDVLCDTAQPRVLELVGCDYVSAEMLVGIVRASQTPRARAGQKAALAALHVRECVGVDWVLLWPLLVAGMELRMWVRGSEVDFRAR